MQFAKPTPCSTICGTTLPTQTIRYPVILLSLADFQQNSGKSHISFAASQIGQANRQMDKQSKLWE